MRMEAFQLELFRGVVLGVTKAQFGDSLCRHKHAVLSALGLEPLGSESYDHTNPALSHLYRVEKEFSRYANPYTLCLAPRQCGKSLVMKTILAAVLLDIDVMMQAQNKNMCTTLRVGVERAMEELQQLPSFDQSEKTLGMCGNPENRTDIVYKNGQYVPSGSLRGPGPGLDPFFDVSLPRRLRWMNDTDRGRNVPPGDESGFAHEREMLGLPRRKEAAWTPSSTGFVPCLRSTGFEWLSDPSNMTHMGIGDAHRCSSCGLIASEYVQGDTFLNQHAFFSGGECPYLKANYTPERLAVEIGQARFAKGLVAHPEAIWVPDAWNRPGQTKLSHGIYVRLTDQSWCYDVLSKE
ncbi:hypothetical protein Q5P01_017881 [Channa striata]|uniref:Uncharacterized protein n=1 Tax=Channa striata TaxID=64152 RepID=A0AA88M3S9_CHASR|nr:hypothetical protein Q5P01_017881 [Channa striata]